MAISPGATKNGAYDTSADPWAIGAATLANAVMGNETDTTGTSSQTTDNTSAQTSVANSAQNTVGSSSLTGATTQEQAGTSSQNTTGVQAGTSVQTTSGSNVQAGTQTTGGTTTSSTGGNVASTQTTSQQADTTQLQAVYDKQMGGVTPEILAAIFQQGAKAAPNLVTAQAGALGARGVGNTPMAAVLNQLNADLTSKAALINAQMLGDAGGTAANIADLTKSTSVTGNQAQQSVTSQVQDLITATNNTSTTQQIANAINETTSQQQQSGTSTQSTAGTSTQQQASQQAVTGTQDSTQSGTQHQVSNLTKEEQTQQTQMLNTNLGGQLAKLAGAGLGLASLYKLAKDSGFLGTVSSFINSLKLGGATTEAINAELSKDGLGLLSESSPGVYDEASTAFLGQLDSNTIFNTGYIGNPPAVDNSIDGFPVNEFGEYVFSFPDAPTLPDGEIMEFADGGELKFLATPDLATSSQGALPSQQDSSLLALLDAIKGGGGSTAAASQLAVGGEQAGSSSGGSGSGESSVPSTSGNSDGSGTTSDEGIGFSPASGNPNGPDVNPATLGMLGGIIGKTILGPLGGTFGNFLGRQVAGSVNENKAEQVAAYNDAAKTAFTRSEHEAFNAITAASTDNNLRGLDSGNGYSSGSNTGYTTNSSDSSDSGPGPGAGHGGYADGGKITGPGTGTSDSIYAAGPGNSMIRVANGEYILPADTTASIGVDALDALVSATHIPADLQRAMTGEK